MTGPLLTATEAARLSPKPGRTGLFSYVRAITYYIHVGLATVVIGGILSSTLLTLLVLPVLYRLSYQKDEPDELVAG